MDRSLFISSMAYLQKLFGKKLDDDTIKIYWGVFRNVEDGEWREAVRSIVSTFVPTAQCPFPLPAHFVRARGDDPDSYGRRAIRIVREAVGRYGRYRSVDFGDAALHAVIMRYGGWPAICDWSDDDWLMKERAFVDAYVAESKAQAPNAATERLAGLHEQQNRLLGYDYDEAVKISYGGKHESNTAVLLGIR